MMTEDLSALPATSEISETLASSPAYKQVCTTETHDPHDPPPAPQIVDINDNDVVGGELQNSITSLPGVYHGHGGSSNGVSHSYVGNSSGANSPSFSKTSLKEQRQTLFVIYALEIFASFVVICFSTTTSSDDNIQAKWLIRWITTGPVSFVFCNMLVRTRNPQNEWSKVFTLQTTLAFVCILVIEAVAISFECIDLVDEFHAGRLVVLILFMLVVPWVTILLFLNWMRYQKLTYFLELTSL